LVEDFVNTRDVETGRDQVSTAVAWRAWLVARDLIGNREPVNEADVETAHEVRESLRALLVAHHDAKATEGDTVEKLNQALAHFPLQVCFDTTGAPALVPLASGSSAALATLLATTVTAMAEGTWSRLKVCPADTCQVAFYDHSKNHSRRWCAMSICGNRTKLREFRERRRQERAGSEGPDAKPPAPSAAVSRRHSGSAR
jgi:predicted RNA-binding Zn ribbon-like protein